jgi:curved DNA-binding protein CbpA
LNNSIKDYFCNTQVLQRVTVTYYQELGVYPDASTEEIRSEYRKQARIFHPDHQTHPGRKEKSEARMRLLNEIVSVLGDPAKRIEYDRLILRPRKAPPKRSGASRWFGGLTAVAALVGAGWYVLPQSSKATPIKPNPPTEAVAATPPSRLSAPSPTARSHSPEPAPTATSHHPSEASSLPLPDRLQPSNQPPLPDAPPLPKSEFPPAPSTLPQRATADEPTWAGDWFYVPTGKPTPTDSGLYPPTYTELYLQEHSGTIYGNYRAIYLVSDKAISGEVRFQVSGWQAPGSVNTLQWKAASGASGQIELTRRGSNLLHAAWWTTRSGDGPPSLGSGSAVLVRQAAR